MSVSKSSGSFSRIPWTSSASTAPYKRVESTAGIGPPQTLVAVCPHRFVVDDEVAEAVHEPLVEVGQRDLVPDDERPAGTEHLVLEAERRPVQKREGDITLRERLDDGAGEAQSLVGVRLGVFSKHLGQTHVTRGRPVLAIGFPIPCLELRAHRSQPLVKAGRGEGNRHGRCKFCSPSIRAGHGRPVEEVPSEVHRRNSVPNRDPDQPDSGAEKGDRSDEAPGEAPDEKGDWKPHENPFPLGHPAQLVARVPAWFPMILNETELDVSGGPGYNVEPTSVLPEEFDQGVEAAREVLDRVTGDQLDVPWSLTMGDQVVSTQPRGEVARESLRHLVHRRGQLTVYLRLLDVPIPSIYGPTADEGWEG